MRPRTAACILALPLLTSAPGADVGNPEDLLPTRMAVETAAGLAEPDLAAVGARLGVGVVSARTYGHPRQWLLELAGALPDGPERTERLRAVAELPGVRFATPVWTDERALPQFPLRRVLARFVPGVPEAAQRAAIASVGGLEVERTRFGGMAGAWKLRSTAPTGDEVLAQAAALAALPGVKWAHPDRVVGHVLHDVIPDDPLFGQCWGLHNTGQTVNGTAGTPDVDMDAPAAWELEQGDASILVVVLDNGVDLTHPDLNSGPSADFTGSGSGGGPTAANACHGTQVAGCIATRMDNALGTVGIAPGCRVSSAAVSTPDGSGVCNQGNAGIASTKVDALEWAQGLGARVTNWSFSMAEDDAVKDMLVETKQQGMIHFASAGNGFPNAIAFPANHHAVHCVGNVRSDGTRNPSSQTGSDLTFAAPGTNVSTTDWQGAMGTNNTPGTAGDYVLVNGTSFASPYAAGVAALVLSRQPSLSSHDVWVNLVGTCRELGSAGWDSSFGYGLVNAELALRVADEMAAGYVIVDPIAALPPASQPTVADAVAGVPTGGLIFPIPGSYDESVTISKACILRSWGTTSTVIGE